MVVSHRVLDLMFRSSAPTGWSQITSHNNKAFRVVSGTGGGSGGSNGFTSAFASRNVSGNAPVSTSFNLGNATLSTNQMASHSHPYNGGGGTQNPPGFSGPIGPWHANRAAPGGPNSGNAGSGSNHNHGVNSSSNGGSVSANQSFAVQYVNVIICNHS